MTLLSAAFSVLTGSLIAAGPGCTGVDVSPTNASSKLAPSLVEQVERYVPGPVTPAASATLRMGWPPPSTIMDHVYREAIDKTVKTKAADHGYDELAQYRTNRAILRRWRDAVIAWTTDRTELRVWVLDNSAVEMIGEVPTRQPDDARLTPGTYRVNVTAYGVTVTDDDGGTVPYTVVEALREQYGTLRKGLSAVPMMDFALTPRAASPELTSALLSRIPSALLYDQKLSFQFLGTREQGGDRCAVFAVSTDDATTGQLTVRMNDGYPIDLFLSGVLFVHDRPDPNHLQSEHGERWLHATATLIGSP